jgi:hypothetical protein
MPQDKTQAQKDFERYCELEGIASVPGTFIPVEPDEAEAFGAFEETAISERDALEASYDNADDYAALYAEGSTLTSTSDNPQSADKKH